VEKMAALKEDRTPVNTFAKLFRAEKIASKTIARMSVQEKRFIWTV
jgi:hypothetical protein